MTDWFFTSVLTCSVMADSLPTPWTVAHQVPLSMEFSRQEYWSGLPFPSPGGLPDFTTEPPGRSQCVLRALKIRVSSWPKAEGKIKETQSTRKTHVLLLVLWWSEPCDEQGRRLWVQRGFLPTTSTEIQTSVLWPQGIEFSDNLKDVRSRFIPIVSRKESTSAYI